METKLINLYDEAELKKLRARRRAWLAAFGVIAALTLALCIIFLAKAGKARSIELLIKAIAASIAGGWAALTVRIFAVEPLSRAEKHVNAILAGETETHAGAFDVGEKPVILRRGVALYRVYAGDGSGLSLWEKKKLLFPASRAERVQTVNGFITAYEVKNENG